MVVLQIYSVLPDETLSDSPHSIILRPELIQSFNLSLDRQKSTRMFSMRHSLASTFPSELSDPYGIDAFQSASEGFNQYVPPTARVWELQRLYESPFIAENDLSEYLKSGIVSR